MWYDLICGRGDRVDPGQERLAGASLTGADAAVLETLARDFCREALAVGRAVHGPSPTKEALLRHLLRIRDAGRSGDGFGAFTAPEPGLLHELVRRALDPLRERGVVEETDRSIVVLLTALFPDAVDELRREYHATTSSWFGDGIVDVASCADVHVHGLTIGTTVVDALGVSDRLVPLPAGRRTFGSAAENLAVLRDACLEADASCGGPTERPDSDPRGVRQTADLSWSGWPLPTSEWFRSYHYHLAANGPAVRAMARGLIDALNAAPFDVVPSLFVLPRSTLLDHAAATHASQHLRQGRSGADNVTVPLGRMVELARRGTTHTIDPCVRRILLRMAAAHLNSATEDGYWYRCRETRIEDFLDQALAAERRTVGPVLRSCPVWLEIAAILSDRPHGRLIAVPRLVTETFQKYAPWRDQAEGLLRQIARSYPGEMFYVANGCERPDQARRLLKRLAQGGAHPD